MTERDGEEERTLTHERPATPPETAAAQFTPGTILAGRYRIVAPLGSGGTGEVYRAEDMKLGQTVALKFVSRRVMQEKALVDRIVSEVRIGRQLSHPNLCRIYDMGEVGDQLFITMEYVDGENLASLLKRVGRLPEDKALEVAREICSGLAAAHDRGVIHRDVKPANVMIDGRGNARITDFGLSLADRRGEPEAFAGTPAYMAPEQLHGSEATEQSDIYSLGLVLYEIFTGQRLFAGNLTDIFTAHGKPKRAPSSITRGLSPAIERVILQCIEESPENRPESVREILAALPAGDPLRAAIAAGDTPSPRAVAAAETIGELTLPAAWTGLIAILLLIASIIAASRLTMLYQQAPLTMSPDVLTERARDIIRAAGYDVRAQGSRRWMSMDEPMMRAAATNVAPQQRDAVFARTSPIRFGYRESPVPLVPHGRSSMVSATDPPLDVPGMVSVTLDSRGRLVRFVRTPEVRPGAPAPADWKAFLGFAGLDAAALQSSQRHDWISPVEHDQKRTWAGVLDNRIPITIRGASLAGRPVFFEVDGTASRPVAASHAAATATEQFTGVVGFAVVFVAGLILAAIVARRNIRLGRGDRAAARKIGLIVFATTFAAGILSAHHTSDLAGEWELLVGLAGTSLYNAGAFWLFYMAAEPYVRRRQPELLISWNRVVRGYYRDPLIGRHILYGCILGALINLFYAHFPVLAPLWLGGAAPLPDASFPEKLLGGVWPFVSLAALLGSVPLQCVLALFLFSALRSIVRNGLLAAAILAVVAAIPFVGRGLPWQAEVPFVLCGAALFVFALSRIGLLAGMVGLFVSQWLNTSLFIFDPRSWLFMPSLIYTAVLVAIVLFGFRGALGTKPVLGNVRLAE